MLIRNVLIEDKVKEKITEKHGVQATEIKNIMLNSPLVLKTRLNRFMAIGHFQRYLTVIFEYNKGTANIITAYPSSEAQTKLYKKRK